MHLLKWKNLSTDKANSNEQLTDCDTSCDGSWQKRSSLSRNGLVPAIWKTNRTVLGFAVINKDCKSCKCWENEKDAPEYKQYLLEYNCTINHD